MNKDKSKKQTTCALKKTVINLINLIEEHIEEDDKVIVHIARGIEWTHALRNHGDTNDYFCYLLEIILNDMKDLVDNKVAIEAVDRFCSVLKQEIRERVLN